VSGDDIQRGKRDGFKGSNHAPQRRADRGTRLEFLGAFRRLIENPVTMVV